MHASFRRFLTRFTPVVGSPLKFHRIPAKLARAGGLSDALAWFTAALLVATIVALDRPANAWATNVSGTISTNTTWTAANSPYVMTGNVSIASGVTLTIDPGVTVEGNSSSRLLTVSGSLSAVGTGCQPDHLLLNHGLRSRPVERHQLPVGLRYLDPRLRQHPLRRRQQRLAPERDDRGLGRHDHDRPLDGQLEQGLGSGRKWRQHRIGPFAHDPSHQIREQRLQRQHQAGRRPLRQQRQPDDPRLRLLVECDRRPRLPGLEQLHGSAGNHRRLLALEQQTRRRLHLRLQRNHARAHRPRLGRTSERHLRQRHLRLQRHRELEPALDHQPLEHARLERQLLGAGRLAALQSRHPDRAPELLLPRPRPGRAPAGRPRSRLARTGGQRLALVRQRRCLERPTRLRCARPLL